MSSPIIEVENLYRRFENVQAVNGVSFAIYPGEVVGFIGANGAGKTTTMRIMATLELPDEGSVRICGHDVVNFPNKVRQQLGWMPDSFGTYDNMTVVEYLDFYGRAFGYKKAERAHRVEEVMEFTSLVSIADRPMNKLSKGMGQRLCLGRTLVHDPSVLILDEPAAGLDPKARLEFKELVRRLGQRGKTIFISSHILSELGEMCDTLLFIDAGRVVHHGSSESLKQQANGRVLVEIEVAGPPSALLEWVHMNPGVELVEALVHGARVQFSETAPDQLAAGLRRMIQDGIPVVEFHRQERRLEEAFVDILSKGVPALATPPPLPPLLK